MNRISGRSYALKRRLERTTTDIICFIARAVPMTINSLSSIQVLDRIRDAPPPSDKD